MGRRQELAESGLAPPKVQSIDIIDAFLKTRVYASIGCSIPTPASLAVLDKHVTDSVDSLHE